MTALPLISRIFLPVAFFLFIGVPLESYVRGLGGVYSLNVDVIESMSAHLFVEAAAAFYCVTILSEGLIVVTRPHIRNQKQVPVQMLTIFILYLTIASISSYVLIRMAVAGETLDRFAATCFLGVVFILSAIISFGCHFIDFIFSDAASTAIGLEE